MERIAAIERRRPLKRFDPDGPPRKSVFGDKQLYVYFALSESGASIKVGVSIHPLYRVSQLGCKLLFAFEGSRRDERDIHDFLEAAAAGENEWFRATPVVMEYVREVESRCG